MKEDEKLRKRFGTDPGFRVPDGYFDEVFTKIQSSLPEREPQKPVEVSRWQRFKPYLYLAAMFAGIWCMMKMIHMIQSGEGVGDVSLDNPPAMIAQAMSSPEVSKPLTGTASMVIIDEEEVAETSVSATEASTPQSAAESVAEEQEMMQDFSTPVVAEDIDLAQLKQALEADTSDDLYYM